MNDIPLSFDAERAFQALETAAEKSADADYAASRLEELKSVVLAEIMVEHKSESAAKAEMLAKADPRYRTHIEGMCEARRQANKAKARYKDLLVLADMRRTGEASIRQLTR